MTQYMVALAFDFGSVRQQHGHAWQKDGCRLTASTCTHKAADRLRKDKAFAISVLREKPFEIEEEVVETVWERHKDHWMMRMDLSKGDSAFDAEMVEVAMELKKIGRAHV